MKRNTVLAWALALSLTLSACGGAASAPAREAETAITPSAVALSASAPAFSDVPADAWYAPAVNALNARGVMTGTGTGFAPEATFDRASLAMVLYRLAGEPAVTGEDTFPDTQPGQWYTSAVTWAQRSGTIRGYDDGRFGIDDPVTQEQLAVMLWRSAGSYVLGDEYADPNGAENRASPWAVDAVRWSRVDGLLTDAVPFAPTAAASRALVADMVYRYLGLLEKFSQVDATSGATGQAGSKILVAYFSATGHTKPLAEYVAQALDADLYEITPETLYTSADLNYSDSSTRATREQNDSTARPAIAGELPDLAAYSTVILGHPIWWGQAPKILYTFVESYDWTGKTVATFCTSGSSEVGTSASNLLKSMPGAKLVDSRRFSAGESEANVTSWAKGLDLPKAEMVSDTLTLAINGKAVEVEWEDNPSVEELRALVAQGPITVAMSPYGGFEQVGSLGRSLTRNDVQTTTAPGDIVLYSGNQLVLFHGSNSWAYTRLGHIRNQTQQELKDLLGGGGVTVTLSLDAETVSSAETASGKPAVYFTSDLTPEGLVAVYDRLHWNPTGKVAVKVSTGEPPASNYLRADLIGDLVKKVDGTIVECNTAYGGSRSSSAMHKQVAADHGFTSIADFDLMDEEGEVSWPVTGGNRLDRILVGSHAENYQDWLILSHYKGHAMAGFGGAIKNVGIGCSSASGKVLVHTAGTKTSGSIWYSDQDAWLEALAEMVDGFADHVGSDHIVYVNVMNRLSVDCDCDGHPAEPDIHDIGILASTDPVALDQACYDLVAKAEGNTALMNRIDRQHGLHTLEHAQEVGLGTREYTLVNIG